MKFELHTRDQEQDGGMQTGLVKVKVALGDGRDNEQAEDVGQGRFDS